MSRRKGLALGLSLTAAMWFGILTHPKAVDALAGALEFDQWLGITSSNKTWLWLICMVVIGCCLGYLSMRLYKKIRLG